MQCVRKELAYTLLQIYHKQEKKEVHANVVNVNAKEAMWDTTVVQLTVQQKMKNVITERM